MNTDLELSERARAAGAFTGRELFELLDEGVHTESALTEHAVPHDTPPRLFRVLLGAVTAHDSTPQGKLKETPSGSERGITTAGTPESRPLEDLYSWTSSAQALISANATRIRGEVFARLIDRLNDLLDPDEWELGEPMPSLSSFGAMLRFLVENAELVTPMIGLLRSGHFELSWLAAPDKLTVLEFRDDGAVDWLVFAPAGPGQATKERGVGTCAFELIWKRLRDYGVTEWMSGGE